MTSYVEPELRRAAAALELHRPQDARRMLATVLAAEPDSARALALMAEAMHECGEPPTAWRPYGDRAAAAAPDDVAILSGLADVARRAGDLSGARWYANRALRAGPTSVQALNVHSLVQLAEGHPGDALRTAQQALSRRPDDADLLVAHGRALAELGRTAEAQADYVAALRLDPQHVFARNNLAVERLQCGDLRRASRLLHSAVRDDPRTGAMLRNLTLVAVLTRRLALAFVMLAYGVLLVLGFVLPWAGEVAAWAILAWTVWWVLRMPAPVRRRLTDDIAGWDVVWILLAAGGLVVMLTMLASPGSRPHGPWLIGIVGLRLVLPFAVARVRSAYQLARLGVRLP